MIYQRALVVFLRVSGIVMLFAVLAVFLPHSWMDGMNRWLGLGPLPNDAIVGYLARSLSAFYTMFGVLVIYLSMHVQQTLGVIRLTALMGIVFAVVIFFVDLLEGMPVYWIASEGVTILLVSLVLLWLVQKCR